MRRHAHFPLLLFVASSLVSSAQVFPPQVNFSQAIPQLGWGGGQRFLTTSDSRGGYYWIGALVDAVPSSVTAAITGGSLGGQDIFVVKFDTNSHQVVYTAVIGGSQEEIPLDARADSQGNISIAGTTRSTDFPGVTLPQGAAWTAFVIKLNASGRSVDSTATLPPKVTPVSIDVDAAGRVYVAGRANVLSLPTSAGVLVPSPVTTVHPDDSQPFRLQGSSALHHGGPLFGDRAAACAGSYTGQCARTR